MKISTASGTHKVKQSEFIKFSLFQFQHLPNTYKTYSNATIPNFIYTQRYLQCGDEELNYVLCV